jgi:hypothetical protein
MKSTGFIFGLPPKAKVYEALSAVADGRVKLVGPTKAQVTSSSGDKTYTVEWSDDDSTVSSNDNASHWQHYLGYPILAVWMLRGKLRYDPKIAAFLAGVSWKKLNTQFRNDYDKAIESVFSDLTKRNVRTDAVISEVDNIATQVAQLRLTKLIKTTRNT